MSLLEGLSSTLTEMGFVQLALFFVAVGAYSLAINGSLGSGTRSGAAGTSFAAATGFATLAPSWMGGIVFLAVAVLAVAAFAGAAWSVAALLGLGAERGDIALPVADAMPSAVVDAVPDAVPDEERVPSVGRALPAASRSLAPSAIRLLR